MAPPEVVLLDSGPLGLVSHPNAEKVNAEAVEWIGALLSAGVSVLIPEIADYEVRRELLRAGSTLAYIWLDTNRDGRYEHLFNEDLIELGLARTTTFSHEYRREFERLREEAEARGAGLWSACPRADNFS